MIRPDSSMQSLGALKPSFADMGKNFGFDGVAMQKYPEVERIDHVHTPGNSSGIVDGAAAILIGSKEAGEKAGLRPRARIRACASIGSEPTIMLTGPSFAAERALGESRHVERRHRPLGAERGVCRRRAALHGGARYSA